MKFEIKTLISISLLYSFGASFLLPIYALYVKDIGGTILDAGIAWAVFSIPTGILLIIFGKLEDHMLNKKLMMFLGYLFISFCAIGYIFVQTPMQLFFLQFVLGASIALFDPAFLTLFGLNEDKGQESKEWGLWDGGKSIVMGVGSLIGAFVAYQYGWNTLFILMFVFQFSAALIALKLYLKKE